MTHKRHVDIMLGEKKATFMMLATFHHGKLSEEALAIEIRKLEKLYKLKVLLCKVMDGHHLLLVVHKMVNEMTPKEAMLRNESYDAMLRTGLPATSDLPAVPPQIVYHPHHYPAEKMSDIPSFMHDFLRASCERSGKMQQAAEDLSKPPTVANRPYVFGKYLSIRLQLDCLPRIFSSDDVKQIRQKLRGLGYEGVVRRAPETDKIYVSRRAVGRKTFVKKQIDYEDSLGERFCYKEEKRMKCIREPSIDELHRIAVYSEQYYQEMLKFNLDESLALETAKAIIEANYWQPALPMLLMAAPFLGALMIYDGMNRWLSLSRMRRDGTLSRLKFEAVRRARDLVMSS